MDRPSHKLSHPTCGLKYDRYGSLSIHQPGLGPTRPRERTSFSTVGGLILPPIALPGWPLQWRKSGLEVRCMALSMTLRGCIFAFAGIAETR